MNIQERYKLYNALISNGYLLHGTNAEFSEFNPRKIVGSNRANEGYGFYFTDEAYKAIEYGDNIKAVKKDDFNFIELTSPIDVDILNGNFINNKIEELNYKIDNFQGDEFDLDSLEMKLDDLKFYKKYYYKNDFIEEVNNTINRGAKNYKDLQSNINNPDRYLPMIANILINFKKVNGFHDENVYVIFDFYNLNKKMINNPLELAQKLINENNIHINNKMKQVIRLTESDLHKIVRNTVKRIIKESEGIGMDEDLLERFDNLKEALGADEFCDELMRKMGTDMLRQILPQIEREHEMYSDEYLNSDESDNADNSRDWHYDEQGYFNDPEY